MINAAFNCPTIVLVYTGKIKIPVMANPVFLYIKIFYFRQKYALTENCSSIKAMSN